MPIRQKNFTREHYTQTRRDEHLDIAKRVSIGMSLTNIAAIDIQGACASQGRHCSKEFSLCAQHSSKQVIDNSEEPFKHIQLDGTITFLPYDLGPATASEGFPTAGGSHIQPQLISGLCVCISCNLPPLGVYDSDNCCNSPVECVSIEAFASLLAPSGKPLLALQSRPWLSDSFGETASEYGGTAFPT